MKNIVLIIGLVSSWSCFGQNDEVLFTANNFEQEFLRFEPEQIKFNAPQKDVEWASFVISETKKQLKNDVSKYNVSHYWNIITAFDVLDLDKAYLEIVFLRLANAEGSCEYITSYKDKVKFDDKIPDLYNQYYKLCDVTVEEQNFDPEKYAQENGLDKDLIVMLHQIHEDDQKYRSATQEEFERLQPALDANNQERINELFEKYQCYLGKSLVGEKFSHTMWFVVQHASPEMMEKYLPVLHEAVQKNELDVVPFKMLLDRYHGLTYGYQLFGTQNGFGFKMADDAQRNEVKALYGIE